DDERRSSSLLLARPTVIGAGLHSDRAAIRAGYASPRRRTSAFDPIAPVSSGEMTRQLSRSIPLAELHCHLGAAVTPPIMWGIAHSQGIKLPTKDYWEFRQLITVNPRGTKSFDGYLQ